MTRAELSMLRVGPNSRSPYSLSDWSLQGFVKDGDINSVAILPDVDGEDPELKEGWDKIN